MPNYESFEIMLEICGILVPNATMFSHLLLGFSSGSKRSGNRKMKVNNLEMVERWDKRAK